MVKITAISDLHGNLPDIELTDILLVSGDICPDTHTALQAKWLDVVLREWLNKIPAKHVVVCLGNHDLIFERNPDLVPKELRWHCLQHEMIELEGLKIFGMPWILPIWGAFQREEVILEHKYSQIPNDIDIIISHGPPFGIGDLAPKRITCENEEDWLGSEHCGSVALRETIFKIKPLLCCFGHIHCSRGVWKHGWPNENSMVLANVSIVNNSCEVIHKPMVFNINKEQKIVEII